MNRQEACGARSGRDGRAVVSSVVLLGMLAASAAVFAQSGGGYEVKRRTIDAGGGRMTGTNGVVLEGTIGQPDAGAVMTGANGYQLAGGFWGAREAVVRPDALFANGFE